MAHEEVPKPATEPFVCPGSQETEAVLGVLRCALQERDEQRLLIQSITDYAIFLIDPDGRVISWNKGAERLKGYTEAEILGRSFTCFYTVEDQERGWPQHLLREAQAKGRVEDEGWRVRKDGSRFWADAVLTAIRDAEGRLVGYGKITRDLTERKAADDKIRQLNSELKELGLLKDRFVSAVSHELRTPINALMGFGSMLDDEVAGPLNEQQHYYVRRILSSSEILLNLVNDLLDLSRLQAGKFRLTPGAVDFRALVKDVLDNLTPLAQQKQLELANELPESLPTLQADGRRLTQVITNLVHNAIKFTPAGGRIAVRARLCPEGLRAEVADTGIGIAPQDIPKLFHDFGQLEARPGQPATGTGLGLSISKALIEAHGGQIGVQSAPRAGSTFWFLLPMRCVEPEGEKPAT